MFAFDLSDNEENRATVAFDPAELKLPPTVIIVDRPQPVVPPDPRATRVMQPIERAKFLPPPPRIDRGGSGVSVRRRSHLPWAIAAAAVVCSVLALVL